MISGGSQMLLSLCRDSSLFATAFQDNSVVWRQIQVARASTLRRPWSRLSRQRQNDPVRALRSATATLGLGSLIRWHALAGQLVVYFVTGPMVGDRRSPGRHCWRRVSLPLPPTIPCRFFLVLVNSFRVRQSCASRRVQFLKSCVFTTLRRPLWPAVRDAVRTVYEDRCSRS